MDTIGCDRRTLMSRLPAVPMRDAKLPAKVAMYFTRRRAATLTSRGPQLMDEPLGLYARVPTLLLGYGMLEWATAGLHRVDERLRNLAELKAATLTSCEFCIDLGSHVARRSGLTDEQLLALGQYADSELFTAPEKLVLDYAVGMSQTPISVSDELVARLRQLLDDAQLVELTHVIALENMRGRFNGALGVGAAGFSAGMVCATQITESSVLRSPASRSRGVDRADACRPSQPSGATAA
jgi:AhpD family alkylhydroperoxidase